MSWLDKILPSRIRAKREGKASVPEGLWHKCSNCETVIYRAEYEKNLNVCPKCNHHGRISARKRADIILDKDNRTEILTDIKPVDMLNFKDKEKYKDKFQLSRSSLIATLTQLTSISVSDAINFNNLDSDRIFFAGGGSKNPLIKREILKRTGLSEIKNLPWGLNFKNIESSAFAWLAMTRVRGKPISKGYITGAKTSRLLGIIYR